MYVPHPAAVCNENCYPHHHHCYCCNRLWCCSCCLRPHLYCWVTSWLILTCRLGVCPWTRSAGRASERTLIMQHSHPHLDYFAVRADMCSLAAEVVLNFVFSCGVIVPQVGEHGLWWKQTFYEDSIRVPGILCWAGTPDEEQRRALPAGRRCDRVTSTLDISATMLDALNAPPLPSSPGRSLMPLLCEDSCEQVRIILLTKFLICIHSACTLASVRVSGFSGN